MECPLCKRQFELTVSSIEVAAILAYGKCSYCVRNYNPPLAEEPQCKSCGIPITAEEDVDNEGLCDECSIQKEIDAKDEALSPFFVDDSQQL
jgi:hypothetical protein